MVPQSLGIKVKEGGSAAELLAASVRKTDEGRYWQTDLSDGNHGAEGRIPHLSMTWVRSTDRTDPVFFAAFSSEGSR
jgi:hypothetical protein